MDSSNEKEKVTLSSVVASAIVTALKLVVGIFTGSIGILSEAAHSAIDLVAAIITFFAVRIGDRPADERHHYGYGKVESVSALIETGFLFTTSGFVIYEATRKILLGENTVQVAWYSFAVMVISIIVDYARSTALSKVAQKTGSQAMKADALNFRADMFSSAVVIIGLLFTAAGWLLADAVASICVSIFILIAAWRLWRQTVDILIDAAPEGVEKEIIEIAKKIPEVIDVVQVRVRPVGNTIFADMTVHISRKYPLEKVHDIKQKITKKVRGAIEDIDLNIDTIPLGSDDETIVEKIKIAGNNNDLAVHDVSIHSKNDKKFISFDVEVDSKLPLGDAHAKVQKLENYLKKEVGEKSEIVVHIEPQYGERDIAEKPSQDEITRTKQAIELASSRMKSLTNIHNINIVKHQNVLHVTMHCSADKDMPLEDVHQATAALDRAVRHLYPLIERVTIHTDPK